MKDGAVILVEDDPKEKGLMGFVGPTLIVPGDFDKSPLYGPEVM